MAFKNNHFYTPYGVVSFDSIDHVNDTIVTPKDKKSKLSSYSFITPDPLLFSGKNAVRNVYSADEISDDDVRNAIIEFCEDNGLFSYDHYFAVDSEVTRDMSYMYDNPELIYAQLLESGYANFVYDQYLKVPDTSELNEVRNAFSDLIEEGRNAQTISQKIDVLNKLRDRISGMAEYSLDPGKTPSNRDFINYFLLENKKGYCTHFATAGVIIARMMGIPARYATGYIIVGEDFNELTVNADGSYTFDVKDNRAHAWAEIYVDNFGWVPYEFTAGFSSEAIVTTVAQPEDESTSQDSTTTAADEPKSSAPASNDTTRASTTNPVTSTAAATTTEAAGIPGIPGGHGGSRIPNSVKTAFKLILTAAALIGAVLLRRFIILRLRRIHFTSGPVQKQIGSIYSYTEKLISILNVNKEDMSYKEFSETAEKTLSGVYFSQGEFSRFVDLSLCSAFSSGSISKEDTDSCRSFADSLAGNIYSRSGKLKQLYLKYIKVII